MRLCPLLFCALAGIAFPQEPDSNLVVAALFHDTIADVPGITEAELCERFGSDVAALVVEGHR